MTSMLPPTRDLPPGRHTQIRAELERAVSDRKTSRLTVPILAAAAAVLVVAASVVWLRPGPTDPTPAVHVTTSPTPTAPSTRAAPVVPGLSPERIAAIEKGCQESAGVQGEPKLYQHVGSGPGAFALIYTADAMLACSLDIAVYPFNSAFSSGFDPEWLPGHFAVDSNGASAGGDTPNNRPIYRGVPGYRTAAGRIDSKVAKVTLTVDGQTADATIANNTFVVRIVYPSTWSPGNDVGEVRAYDAEGNLLGSTIGSNKCFVDPKGELVYGGLQHSNIDPKTCEPALPWR